MNDKILSTLLRFCAVLAGFLALTLLGGCLWLNTASKNDYRGAQVAQTLVYSLQNTESAEHIYLSDASPKSLARYAHARNQAGSDVTALKSWVNGSEDRPAASKLVSTASRALNQLDHVAQLHKLGRTGEAVSTLLDLTEGASADALRQLSSDTSAAAVQSDSLGSGNTLNNLRIAGLTLSGLALVLALAPAVMLAVLKRSSGQPAEESDEQNTLGLPLVHTLPIDIQRTEEQFQRIVETSRDGIWVVNTDGETTLVNPRMAEILGYSVKEMLGRHHIDFMDAEGLKIAEENTRRRKMGLIDTEDFRFVRKDGTIIWALVATNPLKDGKGATIGAVAMVTDITMRKMAEEERSLYRSAVEATSSGMVVIDAEDDHMPIVFVNRAFEALSGYRSSEVVGRPATMLQGFNRSGDRVCAVEMARRSRSEVRIELCSTRKDATEYTHEVCVSPIRSDQGALTHFIVVQTEASHGQPAIEPINADINRLERVATPAAEENGMWNTGLPVAGGNVTTRSRRDELTGLSNERMFQEDLELEAQRAFRYNTPLSVLILDIDNFHEFVDISGHTAGDHAIVQIGEIIQDTARQADRVARIAGERFAVIMVNTDQSNSTVLAERLRRNIERGDWSPVCPITATVGVATLGVGMTGAHEFLSAAEEALLHARARGHNQVAHRAQFQEMAVAADH